jgi:hypothetical protein
MLETIALDIATHVLKEVIPDLIKQLTQKLLNPTPEAPTPRGEIKEEEIINKIKKTLQAQPELIRDEIQNDNEKMRQLIQQVLSEIKTLSELAPGLEVAPDQIILSQPDKDGDKDLDSNELAARLGKIERRLDEIAAIRRTEIETSSPSPTTDIKHQQPIAKPSQSDNGGNQDKKKGLPGGTDMEVQVPENPQFKMLENLRRYKEYAESVLRGVNSLPQDQPLLDSNSDQLQDCLERLKEAAEKTKELAASPVKIAIMGEFSSGKTLLVESLIGFSGILPVSETPTTGNVTAIHLIPEEGFKTTEFVEFKVTYLSKQEVQECLHFMLDEAKRRAKPGELPPEPQGNLKTLNEDSFKLYDEWCEEAWNNSAQNRELRYLLRELVIFIRTYASYSADLCDKSFKISSNTAREGLKLPDKSGGIQNLSFQGITQVQKLPLNRDQMSVAILQNSFSLIQRVDIDVKISKDIWNFSTTQDAGEFILLDFPGLGAADSGVRDTFLSLRELAEVQTILILLNGKSSGSDRANKLFRMLEEKRCGQDLKDFVLVGVGRFNQLPIEGEEERRLEEIINSAVNNPLTENTVFQRLNVLKTTINDASSFTSQPDRVILLDQLMHLADLAKRSSGVKAGSEQFLANLEVHSSLDKSKQMRQKWGHLSELLLETDSHSNLGRQLGYFAQDGGIGKLRELIQTHVAAHGLKQLYEDTSKEADKLSQQQDNLKDILKYRGISTEESQALIDLRFYLKRMYKTYENFKNDLVKEPLKDWREIAVSDVVKDELTYKIHNWQEWNLLFNKANKGMIELTESTGDDTAVMQLLKEINVTNDNIPTKSDDFYDVFCETVNQLEMFAHNCIKQAVINLLTKLSNERATEIECLNKVFCEKETIKTKIEQNFDDEQLRKNLVNLVNRLIALYNPKIWEKSVILKVFDKLKKIETAPMFPLARQEEKHDIGQIFDWAPERRQTTSKTANQLLLVQRLRDEMTASVSLHLVQYVSQINKEIEHQILSFLGVVMPDLLKILNETVLLSCIAGDEQISNQVNPTSVILSEIVSISLQESLVGEM